MPRPRSDIKERIVEVALDAFLHKGVDGTSLRALAREAGTNIGMVYYYFATKEELFLGVVEHVYVGLLERLQEGIDPDKDFGERLQGFFAFLASLDDEERRVVRLIVREALASNERMDRLIERFKRGHVPLLIDLVGQGFRSGEISRDHHPFFALACLAGIGVAPQIFLRLLSEHLPELGDNHQIGELLPRAQTEAYLRAFASAAEAS